jgi:hypothetical protein
MDNTWTADERIRIRSQVVKSLENEKFTFEIPRYLPSLETGATYTLAQAHHASRERERGRSEHGDAFIQSPK